MKFSEQPTSLNNHHLYSEGFLREIQRQSSDKVSLVYLKVEEREYPVFVTSFMGKPMTQWVRHSNTIVTLKAKILESEGMPPDQRPLMFAGKRLENCE